MGKTELKHNVNDNVELKANYNVNDNDIVEEHYCDIGKQVILSNITEYKFIQYDDFLFGDNLAIHDCGAFVNPALSQIEKFVEQWGKVNEETRRLIVCRYDYKKYTRSPLWRYTVCYYKTLRKFTCESCGKSFVPQHLVVHHLSYNRIGSELFHPEDVQLLCTDCHLKVHGVRR